LGIRRVLAIKKNPSRSPASLVAGGGHSHLFRKISFAYSGICSPSQRKAMWTIVCRQENAPELKSPGRFG
jgi:hypothetical protein